MITWMEYNQRVSTTVSRERGWRVGQAFFNVLADTRPDLAGVVRGTAADPFYSDDRVTTFLATIRSLW